MKTFALALCILVLALTIQDISARPRGQRPRGQRSQGQVQRGQGQGQKGQGQGRRGPGAEGRRHGGPRFPGRVCTVQNSTTLDVLCNNSMRCPSYTECSPLPAEIPQPPPIGDLLIHSCIPKVCDPEDPTTCPAEATCSPSRIGTESRCIPNERHHRRHFESSSEEDFEEDEENEVEDEDEEKESCRDVVRDAIRRAGGSRGPGGRGRHGLKFRTCLLRNTTSNMMLCNETMSCPDFTQCVPRSADDARRPMVESLEIHECRPMNCTADSSICPTNTTCQQVGATSWCLPEGRHQGRRDDDDDDDDDNESCNEVLKDIFRHSNGRRPFGRRPTADAGFGQGQGGDAGFGQGQGGNGRFGQDLGDNNGPFGIGPLRQDQGLFSPGQIENGGLGQDAKGNDDLDEGEDSSSSEELPRGRSNRPSASAFGQRRGRRQP